MGPTDFSQASALAVRPTCTLNSLRLGYFAIHNLFHYKKHDEIPGFLDPGYRPHDGAARGHYHLLGACQPQIPVSGDAPASVNRVSHSERAGQARARGTHLRGPLQPGGETPALRQLYAWKRGFVA